MVPSVVRLPGPVILVPGKLLERQVRQQAQDHPGLPVDLRQISADLAARPEGVPATLSEPRAGSEDWSLLLYTQTYVIRLFLTKKYKDAYTIAAVTPLQIRDHHRLAQGCLLVRSFAGWRVVLDTQQIPQKSNAHWSQLFTAWHQLISELGERKGAPSLNATHVAFLDTLDQMIDATEKLTAESRSERPFLYRDVRSTGGRRHGTRSVYEFQIAGTRRPDMGAFVQVRGEPEQRGQVTRVGEGSITVRFERPVDWARIHRQGEFDVTPSSIVYDKQREAVAQLRTRQAHNPSLLSVLVDHQVHRIRPGSEEPTEVLDDDQLEAFRKALAVDDMMLVLGPPGTGKTRTISQIAQACAAQGVRVLVTSHTNRAVDNILARLPESLLAIRVGHEGKVTAEGEPYLLERQATELRTRILNVTARTLASYEHVEIAGRWADVLGDRTEELRAALAAAAEARAELDRARRPIGGAAQVRVDKLTAEHERAKQALARNAGRIATLTTRSARAESRTAWPLLGPIFSALVRRWARQIAILQADTGRLRDAREQTRLALDEGERALDAVTRDDPAVRAARAALDGTLERCEECRASALVAARTGCAAVGSIDTPPSIWTEGHPEFTLEDLDQLSAWFTKRLPMLAAREALLTDWRREASGAAEQLYPELIHHADVVAATCIGAASRPELADVELDLAIVDEAGQIGVPDVIVPLVRSRRAVLVGDHKQLPPFLDSDVEAWGASIGDPVVRKLLSTSALELLLDHLPSSHVVMLTQQRRMPSAIADFISASFYDKRLETAVQRDHRDPLFRSPMAFVDTAQLSPAERHERSGRDREQWGQAGYTNPTEAELLTELAALYHRLEMDWAVIVAYRAQVAEIKAALEPLIGNTELVDLNVGTVDSFQGGERDIILYGFTRSNADGSIGFLKELRRGNVAFTRARQQLVLVGDMSTLTRARDRAFRELAEALREHLARRGDLRQYREVRERLTELGARAGDA